MAQGKSIVQRDANNYSVNEFLRPFEQTAKLCGMEYLPPFTVMGTHNISDQELEKHSVQYRQMIGCIVKKLTLGNGKRL